MPIGDLLASITGEQSPVTAYTPAPAPQKRKAEGDLRDQNDRNFRKEPIATNISRPSLPVRKPGNLDTTLIKPKSSSGVTTPTTVKAPPPTGSRPSPAPGAPTVSTKPPKKGSFAEIMARGKAASTTMSQVGKIQHKRIEKTPNKREREDDRRGLKPGSQKPANGKHLSRVPGSTNSYDGKGVAREGAGKPYSKLSEPEKKVKKAALATTGYTGTARPVPGKSTSKPTSRYGASNDRDREIGSSRRYADTDEDDDEDDIGDEEQEDYYSDASSDMEAATFEVDEEEERAARIARKEDAAALAEENRLKREKEDKRKRLAAMAKRR